MNNFLYILLTLCSTYVSYRGWLSLWEDYKVWKRDRYKHPHKIKEARLCTNNSMTHNWISIRWRDGEEVTEVQACEECGYIPSKKCMMPEQSLPSLGIWHRERQFLKKSRDAFVDAENETVQDLVRELRANPTEQNITKFYTFALYTHDRMTEHADAKKKEFYEQEGKRGN